MAPLIVGLMLAGCLFLWVGVPLGWLWIGSQIQASASLGTALAVTMVGAITTIIVLVSGLSWLNNKHAELRQARRSGQHAGAPGHAADGDEEAPSGALEPMIVGSAAIVLVGFAIWFFFFAGTSPVPLNLGY